jgi:hypothetical protein
LKDLHSPAGHLGQSSSTPPQPSGQRYWPLSPWASLAGGQAPSWGMPWMTPMPQPHRPSSSSPTVSHLCLLLIVTSIILANVKRLAYSSIYVFNHPSLSAGRDFVDGVLNLGGSGEGGGTVNDAVP